MGNKIKVFLASQSPRRREILGQVFENIGILPMRAKEPSWENSKDCNFYMQECLEVKWSAAKEIFLAKKRSRNDVLVVADTMVFCGGKLMGKPQNKKDAETMLRQLSGKKHSVLTAYQWGRGGERAGIHPHYHLEKTKVTFKKISSASIEAYVKSGEPMDKAGAYGFQGQALAFIDSIEGSYQSVMGFPVYSFIKALRCEGFRGF